MNIQKELSTKARIIEKSLFKFLPRSNDRLSQAIRYSVFSGGKRVRPFLVLEAARVVGGSTQKALPLACALEMIHTYSLIHDDLPAMDDDDLRRGKKTCHRRFDEATAILAGDALLTRAFEVLARPGVPSERARKVAGIVADAVGPRGMVLGQALDLEFQNTTRNLGVMKRVNRLKTGCLLAACLEAGAVWGGGGPSQARRLKRAGESIGFLFQVVDDIIDGEGYARILGREAAYRKAAEARDRAKKELEGFGRKARVLGAFTDFLYSRTR